MTTLKSLSADSESVLIYLAGAKDKNERSRKGIVQGCRTLTEARIDAALKELTTAAYVRVIAEAYELTAEGQRAAKDKMPKPASAVPTATQQIVPVKPEIKPAVVTPLTPSIPSKEMAEKAKEVLPGDPKQETFAITDPYALPRPNTHMLRMHEVVYAANKNHERGGIRSAAVIRFLLAFEAYKDVLPVPVLDGDVLGRSPIGTNIKLAHDLSVSNRHCKFTIKQERGYYHLYVEDLFSTNGTAVDDVPLEEGKPKLLKHGSRLRVGNTVLVVVQVPYTNK